ncbi:MAG: 1-aminocyclopropane-1-carboxylate deaminase/D-cysteine desulfhydrase [Bdellovibrionota bacterium]
MDALKKFESLKENRIPLIRGQTPVEPLSTLGSLLGPGRLFVKREDQTDTVYGGNKVRNLEFLLGEAIQKGAKSLVTLAPLGSNFVAALAAQAPKVSLPVDVYHFVPQRNPQIEAHARFTESQGAQVHLAGGALYPSAVSSFLRSHFQKVREGSGAYFIAPGGSSVLGALGHVSAALELKEQILRGELPEPDYLVVGVGTCGTMAGLLVGLRLAGIRTRVVGVRCVDRILCNRFKVARLANGISRYLGMDSRFSTAEIDLRDLSELAYGRPIAEAKELIPVVRELSGIELDTTYTSKVFLYLKKFMHESVGQRETVLYWHSFSPAAMRFADAAGRKREGRHSLPVLPSRELTPA